MLREAVETVEASGYPYLVLGGLASSLVGRPRWTHDIDLLVRPDDARAVLAAFRAAGFTTEETDPVWIYKAFKDDVMVDIIFMVMGGIYLDDEMRAHAIEREVANPSPSGGRQGNSPSPSGGRQGNSPSPSGGGQGGGLRIRIPSPEDQIVIKAIVHREETSRHWFDALAILGRAELDWDYLLHRARVGARRVLALLIYAQSADILVPSWAIRRLYEEVYAQ